MYEKEIKQIIKKDFEPFGFESHKYPNAIGLWPNEQESLLWFALNSDPKYNFLEIGSFCGGSAVLMCLARRFLNAGPSVVSVDRTFTSWNNAFNRNLYRVGRFDDISVKVQCDSQFLKDNYSGEPISLAFIDGWHSFKAAYNDFLTINNWLVKGGFVVFHDVAPQPYKDGQIEHFYNRALENFDEWMNEELPIYEGDLQLSQYHQLEKRQNFMIDEVVAYIINKHQFKLVDIPVLDGSVHFDKVPEYKHGTTSPYHGMVGLLKC